MRNARGRSQGLVLDPPWSGRDGPTESGGAVRLLAHVTLPGREELAISELDVDRELTFVPLSTSVLPITVYDPWSPSVVARLAEPADIPGVVTATWAADDQR
jgi:hypothetical protein